jgi:glycosyltransferase involved in cell wall biosynthesis
MIIGIDGGFLSTTELSRKTGVYQVGVNLLKWLSKLDKNNNYNIFTFRAAEGGDNLLSPNFSFIKVTPSKLWNYLALPLYLLRNKVDVFIGISQSLPIFCPTKRIAIVYDIGFQKFPELYEDTKKLCLQTKLAVINADKIICTSESTKRDLIAIHWAKPSKIKVIYPGYDSNFEPVSKEKTEKMRKKYKLSSDYLLFVGSLRKIKNIPFLIRGFSEYSKKSKEDTRLVLCGGFSWFDEKIVPAINDLEANRSLVIKLGHVPRGDLPALYSGAKALVSPSLYEGFGLTLLEAMACGCPVITSNIGSAPEVVDNAALLVNPTNVNELVEAILSMRNDNFRKKLIELGFKRIKRFRYENFAQEVLKDTIALCPS